MKFTSSIVSLLLALFIGLPLHAAEIINAVIHKNDSQVVVEYDLVSELPVMVSTVIDVNGLSYTQEKLTLDGDVAKYVHPGKNKKFTWNIKKDFPQWPNLQVIFKGVTSDRL